MNGWRKIAFFVKAIILMICCMLSQMLVVCADTSSYNGVNDFEMYKCSEDSVRYDLDFYTNEKTGFIEAIAVSENEAVAVGFNKYEINVYDSDLNFKYSVVPSYSHCSYALQWQGDDLCIFVKSNLYFICIIVKDNGNAEIYEIADTEKNRSLYNDLNKHLKEAETQHYSYYLEGYQLVRQDKLTSCVENVTDNRYFDKTLLLLPIVLPICIYAFIHRKEIAKKQQAGVMK